MRTLLPNEVSIPTLEGGRAELKRSRPYVIVVTADLSIAFAERQAQVLAGSRLVPGERLPLRLARKVHATLNRSAVMQRSVFYRTGVLMRVSRLDSGDPAIAIFLERYSEREDLYSAAKRFGLTRRQMQVLHLMLRGCSAAEIAKKLQLSECTVSDHFKHLLEKTKSENRSEMLSRVLGFQDRRVDVKARILLQSLERDLPQIPL